MSDWLTAPLVTPRLRLRAWTAGDQPYVVALTTDAESARSWAARCPTSRRWRRRRLVPSFTGAFFQYGAAQMLYRVRRSQLPT